MPPKRSLPSAPPVSDVALSVSAADTPMGYARRCSRMKYGWSIAQAASPRTVPASEAASTWTSDTSAPPSIHRPGMVKARPPATMDPALMAAWQTLASCRLWLPKRRSAPTLASAAKTIGQGSAPSRSAMKSELAVRIAEPSAPMTSARAVRARSVAAV